MASETPVNPSDFAPLKQAITRHIEQDTVYEHEVRSVFGWTDIPKSPQPATTYEVHEASRPRLPIPYLDHTCDLYLQSVRPLLTDEEYAATKEAVEEFRKKGGEGERLQQLLKDFDAGKTGVLAPSWLEPFWDDAYLVGRDPIAINVNYFFGFKEDPNPACNTQVGRAASLLQGAMRCAEQIRNGTWQADRGLSMSQYPRVFGATRLPGLKRDTIVTYTTTPPLTGPSALSKTSLYEPLDPKHVVVMCENRFFVFDAFKNNKLLPLSAFESAIGEVLQRCSQSSSHFNAPVGVFTAVERDTWYNARDALLMYSKENEDNLQTIQSALLIVCLDAIAPANDDEYVRLLLHGPGTNRWFDKHNLIVAANGRAGINFEHSVGDGTTTLRIADEIFRWSTSNGSAVPATGYPVEVKELQWSIPDQLLNMLRQSYAGFKQAILANETVTLNFTRFGGAFIKNCAMSPDALVQVAIQLAYYKMFGRPTATYESASTRAFIHGRTETVRSCTQEALDFCKAALSQPLWGRDTSTQYDLLQKAVMAHVAYMKEAKEANGVDRHLYGLRMMAEQEHSKMANPSHGKKAPLPKIYEDPAYARSSFWGLSTSHCGSPSLSYFGFGPVVYEGFGVGYMIKNLDMQFVITAKYHEKLTSAGVFAAVLEEALLLVRAILLSNPKLRKEPPTSMRFTHPTSIAAFSYLSEEQLMYDQYDAPVFGY